MNYNRIKMSFTTIVLMILLAILAIFYTYVTFFKDPIVYDSISISKLEKQVKNNKKMTMYFYKKDCPACKNFKPTLNSYYERHPIDLYGLDVGSDKKTYYSAIDNFKITVTPTLIYYDDGVEMSRLEGNSSITKVEQFFKDNEDKK